MLLRRSLLQLLFAWVVVLVVAATPFGVDLGPRAAWAQDDEDDEGDDED